MNVLFKCCSCSLYFLELLVRCFHEVSEKGLIKLFFVAKLYNFNVNNEYSGEYNRDFVIEHHSLLFGTHFMCVCVFANPFIYVFNIEQTE